MVPPPPPPLPPLPCGRIWRCLQEGVPGDNDGSLGGCLQWPQPHCQPFRSLIAHSNLVPYMDELLGPGWRLDGGGIGVMLAKAGRGGHGLHGAGDLLARVWQPDFARSCLCA